MKLRNNESKTLTPLPYNKTVILYTPLEGSDIIARTGISEDTDSFFHCLLHILSKEYIKMDKKEKINLVNKLKKSLASKNEKENWEDLSLKVINKIYFQDNLISNFKEFYNYINSEDGKLTDNINKIIKNCISNDKDKNVYILISKTIKLDVLEKDILPKIFNNICEKKIKESKMNIKKELSLYFENILNSFKILNKEETIFYNNYLSKLLENIVNLSEEKTKIEYIKNTTQENYIDENIVNFISERFNRDLYFIDSNTRIPYKISDEYKLKKRKSIIMLSLDNNRYEIVGSFLHGNHVKREFNYEDNIIQNFYNYLENPKVIIKKFPKIVSYIPRKIRKKLSIEVSDSEEEREQDIYHGSKKEQSIDI